MAKDALSGVVYQQGLALCKKMIDAEACANAGERLGGDRQQRAMDSARWSRNASNYAKRFPEAVRIGNLG